jgi:hypothetical protein
MLTLLRNPCGWSAIQKSAHQDTGSATGTPVKWGSLVPSAKKDLRLRIARDSSARKRMCDGEPANNWQNF